jgi:hypothetical protein
MIAGEENDQDRVAREVVERVGFPIRGRKPKVRRALADLQGKAHVILGWRF